MLRHPPHSVRLRRVPALSGTINIGERVSGHCVIGQGQLCQGAEVVFRKSVWSSGPQSHSQVRSICSTRDLQIFSEKGQRANILSFVSQEAKLRILSRYLCNKGGNQNSPVLLMKCKL